MASCEKWRSVTPPSPPPYMAGGVVPALKATGLCKRFGGIEVTRCVSLELARGARTALIGPNGAGKTTLVNMLTGVLTPDAGRVEVFGQDLTATSSAHRTRLGLVRTFQISSLFAGLTVFENLFIAASQRAGSTFTFWRAAARERDVLLRCEALVEQFRLGADVHRKVGETAYGRQRLVEIAIALAMDPRVLLLDEPAAGIPSGEVDMLIGAIERLPSEIAILMIEHDMNLVRRIATEVSVLVNGSVLATGSPKDVMANREVQAVYLGPLASNARREQKVVTHA